MIDGFNSNIFSKMAGISCQNGLVDVMKNRKICCCIARPAACLVFGVAGNKATIECSCQVA
jgi:hypothetical protein